MKELKFYKTETGREPLADWLEDLDKVTRAKINSFLDRVALGGAKKNIKRVGFGVFEIKIDYGPGYRVYFGEIGKVVILLLVGGDKSTQVKDIKLAQIYWRKVYVQK